tara:strand:+ start:4576 stop:4731 length:156 start_codon:yes stop_codon:yes gene_type:complete
MRKRYGRESTAPKKATEVSAVASHPPSPVPIELETIPPLAVETQCGRRCFF